MDVKHGLASHSLSRPKAHGAYSSSYLKVDARRRFHYADFIAVVRGAPHDPINEKGRAVSLGIVDIDSRRPEDNDRKLCPKLVVHDNFVQMEPARACYCELGHCTKVFGGEGTSIALCRIEIGRNNRDRATLQQRINEEEQCGETDGHIGPPI